MHKCHDQNGLATILTIERSASVVPELNLGNLLQGSMKPRADVTRIPKQENQWIHRKGLMSSKKINKKKSS